MHYHHIVQGEFLERPNRFIARVRVQDKIEVVHVKNTGRCRELLLPGATVYLEKSDNPARKTLYDLVTVEKTSLSGRKLLINMDSQIPNDLVEEWLKKGLLFSENAVIRREVTHHQSRFDFYIEDGDRRIFLEVKGVTLENNGSVSFPDAPTERGLKHIHELQDCLQEGYEACIFFVIQMKDVQDFHPADDIHPAFGEALREAAAAGVRILAYDCEVIPDCIEIRSPVCLRQTGRETAVAGDRL